MKAPLILAGLSPFGPEARRTPTALEVEFLGHLEADGYPISTRKNYKSALNRIDAITGQPAELARGRDCVEIFRAVNLSASTRRLQLAVMRHLHEWLKQQGYPYDFEARNAELPRHKIPECAPLPQVAIAALRRVGALVDDLEWRAYWQVLDGCGVRTGEPLELTLGTVSALLARARDRQLGLRFGRTKTGPWTFPLWDVIAAGRPQAARVAPALRKYALEARPRGHGYDHEAAPFFCWRGKGRGQEWVAERWRQHCALAGVQGAELRRVRHTFGCEALALTGDIRRVQLWMHHASLDTTSRYASYIGMGGQR